MVNSMALKRILPKGTSDTVSASSPGSSIKGYSSAGSGYLSDSNSQSRVSSPRSSLIRKVQSQYLSKISDFEEVMIKMDNAARKLRQSTRHIETASSSTCLPRFWSKSNKVHNHNERIHFHTQSEDALSLEEEFFDNVWMDIEAIKTILLKTTEELNEALYKKLFESLKNKFNDHLNKPYFEKLQQAAKVKTTLFRDFYIIFQALGMIERSSIKVHTLRINKN
jgi:hypothetical protein